MAGLIEIDDARVWSVATWVYHHVLFLTGTHLSRDSPESLRRLVHDESDLGFRYILLSKLSEEERRCFVRAIKQAYEGAHQTGPDSFDSPEFYEAFMDRFRELVEML